MFTLQILKKVQTIIGNMHLRSPEYNDNNK